MAEYKNKKYFKKDENAPDKIEIFVQELSKQIVSLMENCGEWQKTWTGPKFSLPYNALTEARYTGGNSMLLMITSWACGYNDDRWLTFEQLKKYTQKHKLEEGSLKIKAGEKATHILVPHFAWYLEKIIEKDGKAEKTYEKISDKEAQEMIATNNGVVPKELKNKIYYTGAAVFNAKQIPNFPEIDQAALRPAYTEEERNQFLDKFMAYTQIPIKYGFYDPHYNLKEDVIYLPKPESFNSINEFYCTEMHEFFHSTGHESREKRDLTGIHCTDSYSFEEMRAELFSVIACNQFNIPISMENAAAYIKHWKEQNFAKEKVDAIFRASKDAMKVFQYMVDFSEGKRPKAAWLPELPDDMKQNQQEDIKTSGDMEEQNYEEFSPIMYSY